jgi:glycosyltransferase involved in cell wall biosynthesis
MSQIPFSGYVVLQNPISNEGHLDSWHVLFIKLLHDAGFKIIALTSDPSELLRKLTSLSVPLSKDIIVLNPQPKNDFKRIVLRLGQRLSAIASQALGVPRRKVTHLLPCQLKQELDGVLSQYPSQVQAIFNLYIDAYDPAPALWRNFQLKEDVPFLGLCITPSVDQNEGYYNYPRYVGTCFLDEAVANEYRERYPNKQFEYLPDIADTRIRDNFLICNEHAAEIKARARGRKIVFMGGSIGQQKNLAKWHQVIRTSPQDNWFFVQIGRINRNNLTKADEISLESMSASVPENLYVFDGYLPDERVFNEIIATSDVIFAVYRNFERSSNMLSKAAYFRKPILVSQQGLMGERVTQFKIGCTVSTDDVDSMTQGLNAVLQIADIETHFEAYRHVFSMDAMQNKLVKFLEQSVNPLK